MNYDKKKYKYLTLFILPILWLAYFFFELLTGRVNDLFTLLMNLALTIVFAFVGYIIYILSIKFNNGFSKKTIFIIFVLLFLIDQVPKFIIKSHFFDRYIEIIPNFLSFNPIINTEGSWLNARFGFDIGFPLLITINIMAVFLFIEVYRYSKVKGFKSFDIDLCYLFITVGALCSLIDKVFYGGSLDFIGISDLFIADIKDIYINIAILFFILAMYKNNFLSDDNDTSLKEDFNSLKKFGSFVLKDIKFKK